MENQKPTGNIDDKNIIASYIKDLNSNDTLQRQTARESLVKIGVPALDYLIELVNSKQLTLKWEAIKAIGQIAYPSTASILSSALEDDEFEIRWLAAEGLINLGKEGVKEILNSLIHNSDSVFVREGAHHVLKELHKRGVYIDKHNIIEMLDNYKEESLLASYAQNTLDDLFKSTR